MEQYDFSGYATRNDLLCADGRTIRKNAFIDDNAKTVPIVWKHDHDNIDAVLGHALLENRDDGVYAYGKFNDSENGLIAKNLVMHGDIRSLSIYANNLKEVGGDVIHGVIREVSLVHAGANPGAYIDTVLSHDADGNDDLSLTACWDENIMIYHSGIEEKQEDKKMEDIEKKDLEQKEEIIEHADPEKKEETIGDVFNTLSDKQKEAVYAIIGSLMEGEEDQEDEEMKHNVFENETNETNVLSHDAMATIIGDAKRHGSLKESVIAHSQEYGIENIDYLFPEAKSLNTPPDFISREMTWVDKVMNSVHHTPFSRIKSVFADITEDEARAKGYIKGKLKKEEVFSLLKRTTTPTTIYKKQKLDRDDIIDITDFDVVAWLKTEMRMMLNEEIARAILIGDGRLASSDDKINELNIRPIWKDDALYTVKETVNVKSSDTGADKAKAFIDHVIRSRKNYKGSGTPTLYTTEDMVTECLLIEDGIGHKLYKSVAELATALRVKEIVTVEVMEGVSRDADSTTYKLMGLVVNLTDYNVGADKGGAVNMFDDFDIDYNQQKYLIETRCSGALIKPFSAIAIEEVTTA